MPNDKTLDLCSLMAPYGSKWHMLRGWLSVTVSGQILASLTWVPAIINEKEVFMENVNYMKHKQSMNSATVFCHPNSVSITTCCVVSGITE